MQEEIKIYLLLLYYLRKKKFKVGPAIQRLGVLKKGPFWAALRVGQIGGKLHISYAKPS